MGPKREEQLQRQVAEGNKAREVKAALGDMLIKRREQVAREAVAAFRTPPFDGNMALQYIAVLSELMALQEELDRQEELGERALETLMKNATVSAEDTAEDDYDE